MPFPGTKLPRERWTRTRVGLGERGKPFDWNVVSGREAPRVLDLGCGNGRFLIASALARPTHDHVGIELVPPAVKFGSLRAGQRGLTNLKFAWGDATEFLFERCPSASVDEIHLYHPQPYYEAAHVGRRQLNPEVLYAIHRCLVPGGLFVVQTDNPAYATYLRAVLPALFEVEEHPEPWPDAPFGRTLREIVARQQDLEIVRLLGTRLPLTSEEAEDRARALREPTFDANKPGYLDGQRLRPWIPKGRGAWRRQHPMDPDDPGAAPTG